jgi:hypothetical protein
MRVTRISSRRRRFSQKARLRLKTALLIERIAMHSSPDGDEQLSRAPLK